MASVDGLVTGLDTTSIISQLMQLEAQPQTRLKTKASEHQQVQSAYQQLNARMLAIQTAAESLTKATTWQGVKATSDNAAATVSASTATTTGSVTFNIDRLAAAHVVTSKVPASGSLTTGSFSLTIGGKTTPLTVKADTAQGVADAVNSAKLGVQATVLNTADGQVLQFASATTGAAQEFTVDGLTEATSVLSQAVDAQLSVGTAGAGGYSMTSKDNTFTGLLPGVTIRATAVATKVTVASTADADALASAMSSLVSAINSGITQVDSLTAYNSTTKTAAVLNGDGLARDMRNHLQSGISKGVTDYGSLSALGVKLDRSGSLSFDKAKFLAAYQADPAKVQKAVQTEFAEDYRKLGVDATDATKGRITLAVQNQDTAVRRLNTEITDWDTRLAARRVAIQRQYTNLETALGRLKDQSSWLAGQLASLPTSS
jgi:flagellar hook-associated protein 2